MKIAICDDNKAFVDGLIKYLDKYQIEKGYDFEVDSYFSVEDLYQAIEDKAYKLIFLDIEFPAASESGIDLANKLRYVEKNFSSEIIFVSGSDSYFRDLLSFQPFGFLEKPVAYKDLVKILDLFFSKAIVTRDVFTYKKSTTSFILPYNEILYFASYNRKIKVKTLDGSDSFYDRLDNIEETLDQEVFLRVHKSYIINTNFIKDYSLAHVSLINGESIAISNSYAESFVLFLERKFGGESV